MFGIHKARTTRLVLAVVATTLLTPLALALLGGEQTRLLLPILAVWLPLQAMTYLESRLEPARQRPSGTDASAPVSAGHGGENDRTRYARYAPDIRWEKPRASA